MQAANALIGKSCRAFIAPVDVRLPKQDEANEFIDTVVQPDVLVVYDKTGAACAVRRTGSWKCYRRLRP